MPIDPQSFIIKTPQIANPLDLATSAAKLQELRAQGQERQIDLAQKQRAFGDDTTMRRAAQESMVVDPATGQKVLDRGAYLSKLGSSENPLLAQKVALSFGQQDLEKAKQQNEFIGSVMHSIDSPEALNQAINTLHASGNKTAADALKTYGEFSDDPNSPFQTKLNNGKMAHLAEKQQFEVQNMQQEQAVKKNEAQFKIEDARRHHEEFVANQGREAAQFKAGKEQQAKEFTANQAREREAKGQEMGMKQAEMEKSREQFMYGKQQEANQQFAQTIESARQSPEVKQSLTDHLQAQKFGAILDKYANNPKLGATIEERLDKVPVTEMKLAVQEASKMAKGGASTEGEFMQMLPDTRRQKMAEAYQNFISGKNEPGEAGSFLGAYRKYIADLDSNAQSNIKNAYYGSLGQHARYMAPEQVKFAEGEGFKKFMTTGKSEAAAAGHADAVAWARDPKAPGWSQEKAAKILELNNLQKEAEGVRKGNPTAGK